MRKAIREWGQHGMVIVLLLLCFYYSVATFKEQPGLSIQGARKLADRIAASDFKQGILLVGRDVEEDIAFLNEVESALRRRNIALTGKVTGDPRAARQELEKLAGQNKKIQVIVATPASADWTVLNNIPERFPNLGAPTIFVPESYRWPTFLTRQNLLNVANQITVVAILAIGMTVVIITGGIDLSVGSLVALAAVMVSALIRDYAGGTSASPIGLALCGAAAVAGCAAVGAFSGLMVSIFKVPAFIATLAVMQVASGVAFILAKGGSIYEVPDSFTWLGRGTGWFGIPHAVTLTAALFVMAHLLMTRTALGRWIYAVGGNAEAARFSGVKVGSVLRFAYFFSGAMAGLGGVLLASQLKSGAPTYGLMYELYVIAAVVVGGTSLSGGEGKIFGTLVGALIIAVIQNGMNLTGVESYLQKVVLGLVILGAVLLDLLKKKSWR